LVKPRRAPQAIDFLNFTGMTSRLEKSVWSSSLEKLIMPSWVAAKEKLLTQPDILTRIKIEKTPSEFVRPIDREHDGLRPPGGAT
jgi:hypothetical protein